jgi:hypothetical protein
MTWPGFRTASNLSQTKEVKVNTIRHASFASMLVAVFATTALGQDTSQLKIVPKQFYIGEKNRWVRPFNGERFACSTSPFVAADAVCKFDRKDRKDVKDLGGNVSGTDGLQGKTFFVHVNSQRGNRCGYEYYVVSCVTPK